MNQFIDYYSLLGIGQNASQSEIIDAYKRMCLKWHPDRNPKTDTTKKMQAINEAKRVLCDKILRDKYNRNYRAHTKAAATNRTQDNGVKNNKGTHPNGSYVCNMKTDDELFRICANAAKYNFEFIHAVLQELKKRNYTLEAISRKLKDKG